jgi:hypothetical protein
MKLIVEGLGLMWHYVCRCYAECSDQFIKHEHSFTDVHAIALATFCPKNLTPGLPFNLAG